MPKMPDAIFLTFFTYVPLGRTEGVRRLLQAFEEVPNMQPTHWGLEERQRFPYDQDEMVREVGTNTDDFFTPVFRRRKPPRYEAFFASKTQGLSKLEVSFDPVQDEKFTEAVFTLGDALARLLDPELGWVHPVWRLGEESQSYSAAAGLRHAELQKFGLNSICARNWYGRRLTYNMTEEVLSNCGAITQETPWYGMQLDLVERPWELISRS
jgi:hypothetical protein